MLSYIQSTVSWEIIGKLAVAALLIKLLFSVARGLYGSFIAAGLGLNANLRKYGKWAVVTGSTDGIGKAFALELAKKGMNIVLISRNLSKLQDVATEIEEKYSRETKVIDVDFTSLDIYERIRSELETLEIGVLINNVGMSVPFPDYFETLDDKLLKDIIFCNIMSVSMMTKVVLPGMKERKKGMIINVSSLSSIIPAPLLSLYGSTKAYITNLSQNISAELKNSGVEIQCIYPGYVVSKMSKIRRNSLTVPTPSEYVKSTLASTGIDQMTAGYHIHKIQIYGLELCVKYLPSWFMGNIVYFNLKKVRALCLKKRAAKKE